MGKLESSCIPRNERGVMDEQEDDFASICSTEDEDTVESVSSSSSDNIMDNESSSEEEGGPLFGMSNLIAQLPFKTGLSKHFHGKSQSFSSLCDVKRLEDLAKPERVYKKKLNASKSCGGVLDYSKALSCAKTITKKTPRTSFSSLGQRRNDVLGGSRPNFPSLRSSGDLSGHALLFA